MATQYEVTEILSSISPSWASDSSTNHCHDCKQKIKGSIFRSGKSHCRLCGCIICKKICAKKYFVSYRSTKQCVCSQCYTRQITIHAQTTQSTQPSTPKTPSSHSYNTHIIDMMVTIVEMDLCIAQYYAQYGITDQKSNHSHTSENVNNEIINEIIQENVGKFSTWCEDNGIDDEIMNEELSTNDFDCTLVEFDDSFPLNETINNQKDREIAIFIVLKRLYDHTKQIKIEISKTENIKIDIDELLCMDDIEQRMIKTYKSFLLNISDSAIHDCIDNKNILFLISVSQNNGNNLLTNIIDSYRRDSVHRSLKIIDWIHSSKLLTELNMKIKSKKINLDMIDCAIENTEFTNISSNESELDLVSVIKTYPNRMAPVLTLNNGYKQCLINDNIQSIVQWIGTSTMFIQWLFKIHNDTNTYSVAPFMFDFIFLLKPSLNVSNDDSDDDCEEKSTFYPEGNAMQTFSMANIMKYLQYNGCASHSVMLSDEQPRIKPLAQKLYDPFKAQMVKNGCIEYPQYRRFNIIVDRREMDRNGNVRVLIFDAPKGCNVIPKQYFAENLFELSAKCMVPGMGRQKALTSRSTANGQMLSFSYHISADNEVKCYMYWMGRCHRFYSEDIIHVLPKMFDETQRVTYRRTISEFVEVEQCGQRNLKRMKCLKDDKFETFYRAVHGLRKNEFPKPISNKY